MASESHARQPSVAESILIVPAAHTRITDVAFQLEMYELFHRSAGGRLGHLFGTHAILLGVLMLASRAPGPAALAIAVVLVTLMTLWGTAIDRVVGVMTAVLGTLLVLAAAWFASALGPRALVVSLALVAGGCLIQTFSHMFEDVPPPQSGSSDFVPVGQWIRTINARELLRSAVLTFGVFYWLELWATPRIWPVQLLHVMMRVGYRPELRKKLDRRIAEILEAPASSWRRPGSGEYAKGE